MLAGRKLPLPRNLQTVLWACGLRGAVAYGLAVNLPQAGLSDSWTCLLHSLSIFAFSATAHMHTSAAAYCVGVQAVRVGPLLTVMSPVLQIDAESDEGIPAIESATLVIVLVSTLLFGGLTGKPCSCLVCMLPACPCHFQCSSVHDSSAVSPGPSIAKLRLPCRAPAAPVWTSRCQ